MPDDDEQLRVGDVVIGVDPAVPEGTIVFATRDRQGRITQVQDARVLGDGQVLVGPVLRPGEVFDPSRYTDLGYVTGDGLAFPDTEVPDPPRSFASGGIINMRVTPRERTFPLHANHIHWAPTTPDDAGEEQARRAFAERVDNAPAPAGDVLDRIDAAVEELCACGCRRRVPPDGASAYFATQGCQRRWHSAQATDPDEVYERSDAAPVYVGSDHADVPLRPPSGGRPPAPTNIGGSETLTRIYRPVDVPPPCPDPEGVAYRRHCAVCNAQVIPLPARDSASEIMEWGSHQPVRYIAPEVWLDCPRCATRLPGPVFIADARPDGRHLRLTLTDGQIRTRRMVTPLELRLSVDRAHAVDLIWAEMERELVAFRARWIGRTLADERIAMTVANPGGLIRVTGA